MKQSSPRHAEDLFDNASREQNFQSAPLAYRMAPRSLSEYVGQRHILEPGKLLYRAIEADRLSSIVLYGPPGVGKTALARVIANTTKGSFEQINAVTAGLEELRRALKEAKEKQKFHGRKTILFIDEIHRFNKLQQDALLPDVESGTVILVGSTVENPFFYVNAALVSRSQVFELKPLTPEDLRAILDRALQDPERGLGNLKVKIDEEAIAHIVVMADGDARKALSALELAALTTFPDSEGVWHITLSTAEESIQKKKVVYDKSGDQHYDTISAFIKSMRGTDPDAALYYLAKMIAAGEDPRFIARRIVICAAEDVGNADPQALILANAAMQVAEFVGMPEARIPLAQAVAYVACAPKSNAAYLAISAALKDVEEEATRNVPAHLKDTSYPGAKKLGHGEGYQYPHNFPGGYVKQAYMENPKKYYDPKEIGQEKDIKERLKALRGD